MEIAYDPAKRIKTLQERGLDFADAAQVFAGRTSAGITLKLHQVGGLPSRSDDRDRMDTARQEAPRILDEEGQ